MQSFIIFNKFIMFNTLSDYIHQVLASALRKLSLAFSPVVLV